MMIGLARIFHEMDLSDLQGAECKAVLMYRAPFWNAVNSVKAFRPKGDNLRQQIFKEKGVVLFESQDAHALWSKLS